MFFFIFKSEEKNTMAVKRKRSDGVATVTANVCWFCIEIFYWWPLMKSCSLFSSQLRGGDWKVKNSYRTYCKQWKWWSELKREDLLEFQSYVSLVPANGKNVRAYATIIHMNIVTSPVVLLLEICLSIIDLEHWVRLSQERFDTLSDKTNNSTTIPITVSYTHLTLPTKA